MLSACAMMRMRAGAGPKAGASVMASDLATKNHLTSRGRGMGLGVHIGGVPDGGGAVERLSA